MAQPTSRLAVLAPCRSRILALVALFLAAFVASGCSTLNRNAACALVGAGVGATGGLIYGVNEDSYDVPEIGGITVAGAAAGALVGYGACAIADLVQK